MDVELTTTTFVAALPPKETVAPEAKLVPAIVIAVPPAVDPVFGETLPAVGGAPKGKPLCKLPFCPLELTVTVTAPAEPAGVVAVIWVLLTTVTLLAALLPKPTV